MEFVLQRYTAQVKIILSDILAHQHRSFKSVYEQFGIVSHGSMIAVLQSKVWQGAHIQEKGTPSSVSYTQYQWLSHQQVMG